MMDESGRGPLLKGYMARDAAEPKPCRLDVGRCQGLILCPSRRRLKCLLPKENMIALLSLPPSLRSVVFSFPTALRRVSDAHCFSTLARMAPLQDTRTYSEALRLLDSLQSNRTVVSAVSDASRDMNQDAMPEMLEWTRKAGYEASDLRRLRCIHVAGTKGKGSVCAMIENILLQYRGENQQLTEGKRSQIGKVGLYTSPHLVTVRERIRIDGLPISEPLFARYFFDLWDRFSTPAATSIVPDTQSSETKPAYFRYLTLLAFHTFMKEGVETAVVECGIGGEYDSTNILPPEAVTVTAITRLGLDHIGMLGDTVEKIAWHKAGIMKAGVPAYTVEQVPGAQEVLASRAFEKDVTLQVVKRHPALEDLKLGLEGDFQKDNASLAIVVAGLHLQTLGIIVQPTQESISEEIRQGLETVKWPGRCEVREDGNIQWLIDGAHTIDSIKETAKWFVKKVREADESLRPPTATMLIFNQQDRDARTLVKTLISACHVEIGARRNIQLPDRSPRNSKYYSETPIFRNIFTCAAFCTNIPLKKEVPAEIDLSAQVGV